MKIGDNIREIREVEKNYKRSYMAERLGITTRAYANIENNVTDITFNRLEEIANILGCDIEYIINYKTAKLNFYNYFHNYNCNESIVHLKQGDQGDDKLQTALMESQRSRIALLEALLRANNIEFQP